MSEKWNFKKLYIKAELVSWCQTWVSTCYWISTLIHETTIAELILGGFNLVLVDFNTYTQPP